MKGFFISKPISFRLGQAKSGTPFFKIGFKINDAVVHLTKYLSDNAIDSSIQVLKRMGFLANSLEDAMIKPVEQLFKDGLIDIEVGEREYQGKMYTEVLNVGVVQQDIDKTKFELFDQYLKGTVVKKEKEAPKEDFHYTTDSIPF